MYPQSYSKISYIDRHIYYSFRSNWLVAWNLRTILWMAMAANLRHRTGITAQNVSAPRQNLSEPMTWDEATGGCVRAGSTLPGPVTDQEYQQLISLLEENKWTSVWVSLRRRRLDQWLWVNGSVAPRGLVQDDGPQTVCAYLHPRDQILEPQQCTEQHLGFICQRECMKCPSHHSRYSCYKTGRSCMEVHCGIDNWHAARAICKSRSGDLAVLPTHDIIKQFSAQFWNSKRPCRVYWVGLREEDWKIDERFVGNNKQTYWLPGQPTLSEKCAVFTKDGNLYGWKTSLCTSKHHSTCLNDLQPVYESTSVSTETAATTISPETGEPDTRESQIFNMALWALILTLCCIVALIGLGVLLMILIKCRHFTFQKLQVRAVVTYTAHQDYDPPRQTLVLNVHLLDAKTSYHRPLQNSNIGTGRVLSSGHVFSLPRSYDSKAIQITLSPWDKHWRCLRYRFLPIQHINVRDLGRCIQERKVMDQTQIVLISLNEHSGNFNGALKFALGSTSDYGEIKPLLGDEGWGASTSDETEMIVTAAVKFDDTDLCPVAEVLERRTRHFDVTGKEHEQYIHIPLGERPRDQEMATNIGYIELQPLVFVTCHLVDAERPRDVSIKVYLMDIADASKVVKTLESVEGKKPSFTGRTMLLYSSLDDEEIMRSELMVENKGWDVDAHRGDGDSKLTQVRTVGKIRQSVQQCGQAILAVYSMTSQPRSDRHLRAMLNLQLANPGDTSSDDHQRCFIALRAPLVNFYDTYSSKAFVERRGKEKKMTRHSVMPRSQSAGERLWSPVPDDFPVEETTHV